MQPKLRVLLFASLFLFAHAIQAQHSLWSKVEKDLYSERSTVSRPLIPEDYLLSKLDITSLASMLRSVPMESTDGTFVPGKAFTLPLANGEMLNTSIIESPIWSKNNAIPGIKTYVLVNPLTKSLDGRITVTPEGISGIIFSNDGVVYISPLQKEGSAVHLVTKTGKTEVDVAACISNEMRAAANDGSPTKRTNAGDCKRKTYRLAVAATAEYTSWAGSQANALTYITITINNAVAIFERDLNIRFELVTNNSILFTDAAADPYPGPTVTDWQIPASNANQTALDNIIGNGNYDFGTVFSNGWGAGYAPTGVVCKAADKGKSASGINNGQGLNPVAGPQGFSFDFTVAHEFGHLFGAAHTFASNAGFCAPYGNFATAYEPGAGSSLMTYATYATCGNFVNYIEPYFHAGSIAQIHSYLATTTCGVAVTTGNTPPVVSVAATTYHLPVVTPFTLTATGSDADGNTLLYNWEQMNAAFVATPPPGTNTTGPNFRSYAPTTNGNVRTFPRIQDLADSTNTRYERLTSVSRTMNFRVTARDQSALGPCTAEANVVLNFYSTADTFKVTSQSSPITWIANGTNTATITWKVANTNVAPINCTAVNILFSVNGGITYPYTLVSNTANDGSEIIKIPNIPTQAGRIKIQPVNNIFFNINGENITITSGPGCNAEGSTFTPADEITEPEGSALLNLSPTPKYGTAFTPTGTITNSNPSTLLPIYHDGIPSCAVYGFNGVFKYNVHPFVVNNPDTFSFTIPNPNGRVINIYREAFNPAFPCYNFIASNTVTGNSPTTIKPTVSAILSPGNRYVLVIGTYNINFPVLPANYTVNVSGGSIYTDPPSPGASFSYMYAVVNNATGIIKSIAPTADLSNSTSYPAGTSYSVYGLSYSNSSPSLASFIGDSYANLQNAIFYNADYCGNIAKSVLKVNVIPQYTFTGNGNWSDAANWLNNIKPPDPLPSSAQIVINPAGTGECVLDVPISFTPGIKLIVSPGKTVRVL